MDNSNDPVVILSAPTPSGVKFWHAVGGLFIWEFFTTLDYEWRVIRGRLPYRWTIWIYSFARAAALMGVIVSLVIMNTTTPINCQLWVHFSTVFICLSVTAATLLIVLRTIAIWDKNRIVVILAITALGVTIAFHLNNIARLRLAWDPAQLACVSVKTDSSALSFVPTAIADLVFFLIILAGLFILRRRGGGNFGLTHLLWKQGVIWLVLGSAAVVPPLVLTLLHSNDRSRIMFEVPSLIIMTVAATRMHRSLVKFASGSSDLAQETPQMRSFILWKTKRTDTAPTTLHRIEMAVDTTGPVSDDHSSTIISTSERTLEIAGDPSKPNLTRASTNPLLTVSLSCISPDQCV